MKKILSILLIALIFVTSLVIPVSAESFEVPFPPSDWDKSAYPHAVVVNQNGTGEYLLTVCSNHLKMITTDDDNVYFDGNYITYLLFNGIWLKQGEYSGEINLGHNDFVIYSTDDVSYFGTQKVFSTPDFFNPPPPLAEVIQGITEETLQTETLPTVAGTMKILTLCGVGCLALLILLVICSKKFRIFLPK